MLSAKGLQFAIGDNGSPTEVFTVVPDVTEFNLSGTKWDVEETTSHNTTEPVKTIKPTLRSEGEVTLTILWDDTNAQHQLLRTLSGSSTERHFKITYPHSQIGSFTFSGWVTAFAWETQVGALKKGKVTVTVDGALTDVPAGIASLIVSDTQAGVYTTGEQVKLTATYSEFVKVTGTPRVPLDIDGTTKYATYSAGTNTNVLTFTYTIAGGDTATAGQFSITSPVQLNGGSINDLGGNAATLTFTPPTTTAFTVN